MEFYDTSARWLATEAFGPPVGKCMTEVLIAERQSDYSADWQQELVYTGGERRRWVIAAAHQ